MANDLNRAQALGLGLELVNCAGPSPRSATLCGPQLAPAMSRPEYGPEGVTAQEYATHHTWGAAFTRRGGAALCTNATPAIAAPTNKTPTAHLPTYD